MVKNIEAIKEQCIQKLIQNEKTEINNELWTIEDIRTQLVKLKHAVKDVSKEDLLQDPRIQNAIKDREAKKQKELQEYRERQKQEKQRLENLKVTDFDQWIKEYLQRENIDFKETETEIKVMNYTIENKNRYYQIDTKTLEKYGFYFVETNFVSDDYWGYKKTKK